jgi:hypothetical protein
MSAAYPIQSDTVRELSKLIEESTRATSESVKYFVEPTPGVLSKAKNKRHHIIFGRRGSGKSSLLHKVAADLTVSRTPMPMSIWSNSRVIAGTIYLTDKIRRYSCQNDRLAR